MLEERDLNIPTEELMNLRQQHHEQNQTFTPVAHEASEEFEKLKEVIPTVANTNVSKITIVEEATSYIQYLRQEVAHKLGTLGVRIDDTTEVTSPCWLTQFLANQGLVLPGNNYPISGEVGWLNELPLPSREDTNQHGEFQASAYHPVSSRPNTKTTEIEVTQGDTSRSTHAGDVINKVNEDITQTLDPVHNRKTHKDVKSANKETLDVIDKDVVHSNALSEK